MLYNNAPGFISPTVAGTPPITIPVVSITAASGALIDGRIAGGGVTMTWTSLVTSEPQPTGGLISSFSSYGLPPDLSFKPDIGAPGGTIRSTLPLEQGGYGNLSGTSMASPHVAGAVALLLEARPDASPEEVEQRLQNSARPALWWGNPGLGLPRQRPSPGRGHAAHRRRGAKPTRSSRRAASHSARSRPAPSRSGSASLSTMRTATAIIITGDTNTTGTATTTTIR